MRRLRRIEQHVDVEERAAWKSESKNYSLPPVNTNLKSHLSTIKLRQINKVRPVITLPPDEAA